MTDNLPRIVIPRALQEWAGRQTEPTTWNWDGPALSAFVLADGSGPAYQQTVTRICADDEALYVRFDCDDRDIWGTFEQRDDPIYDEEVVEVFIGAGAATSERYFEFEVSPNGVLFDATVYNPLTRREDIEIGLDWTCPGLYHAAGRDDAAGHWWAILIIPWHAIAPAGKRPSTWRANFYRIERPRDAEPEYSCWSPTMTEPADFHTPAQFGVIEIG